MKMRTDIQALRGVAILLVLLDHAKLGPFSAGYLGVDIFFVISGCLITGMVRKDIEAGTFSFTRFYFRRAKRLLPAAYVTFLVTAVLAPFVLASVERAEFFAQLVGAVTFTANVVLMNQAGYFDVASDFKPLLHVWSLSIEEQYYLLLPASMVLVPRRFWRAGAGLLLIVSAAACFWYVGRSPEAAFYLLPTRAWELAIGSMAALGLLQGVRARKVFAWLFWPAVAALFLVPAWPSHFGHPGPSAAIVCLATLAIILRRHAALETNPISRALAVVGDVSYSLYLVHWPVFAFLNNSYVGTPTHAANSLALAAAVMFGVLLNRFVEAPVRRMDLAPSWRAVGATVVASLAVVVAPLAVAAALPAERDYTEAKRANVGFDPSCDFTTNFTPRRKCTNSTAPRILVWGDSVAMHLVPGIVSVTDAGVMQATRSTCGPFLGLAPVDPPTYTRSWARDCVAFNRSVMDYLARSPGIEVVVMSSRFDQYLDPEHAQSLLNVDHGRMTQQQPSVSAAFNAMRDTIGRVRSLGKRVVVFAPPPHVNFDIGECLERRANAKLVLGPDRNCKVPTAEYRRQEARLLEFLGKLRTQAGVDVVRFDESLCSGPYCTTESDGTFLYRDGWHLTYDGSRLLARKMIWSERLGTQ